MDRLPQPPPVARNRFAVRAVCAGRSSGGGALRGRLLFLSCGALVLAPPPLPLLVLCGALRSPPGPLRLRLPRCLAAACVLVLSLAVGRFVLPGRPFGLPRRLRRIRYPRRAGISPVTPRPFVRPSGGVCFVGAPGESGARLFAGGSAARVSRLFVCAGRRVLSFVRPSVASASRRVR